MSQNLPLDPGAASQAPHVRIFQLDAGAFGNLSDAVNRFRGDLNLPLRLVDLKGRNGLDIVVSAFYASNVKTAALTWNVGAPTSVLGLGWQMTGNRIFVDHKQTGNDLDGEYFLQYGGAVHPLIRLGGSAEELLFQSRDFPLWKVRYAPAAELWTVVRENGTTDIYGDGAASARGDGTLMYGVKWGNWIGAGNLTSPPPSRFAMGWNLARSVSPWDDRITYRYLNDELEVAAGLCYTRSSDVLEIEDMLGQKVRFAYEPKKSFEVVVPHQFPDGSPDPLYQDRYDTNALRAIEVHAAGGNILYELGFAYRFADIAGGGDSFKKRLLSAISQRRRGELELPPILFGYDERADAANPGGMSTLTYPEGGEITIAYEEKVLNRGDDDAAHRAAAVATNLFDKNITARPPDPEKAYQPLIWQAFDYLVIGWYTESDTARLDLEIYQFGGRWSEPWKRATSISGRLDLENIQIALGNDFFGLYLPATNATDPPAVVLFQKEQDQFGNWREFDLSPDIQRGESIPAETSFSAGERLLVLRVGGHFLVHRWSFDAVRRVWEHADHGGSVDKMSVAARGNHYVAGYYDDATQSLTYQLFFRDSENRWLQGSVGAAGPIRFPWLPSYGRRLWAMGATYAAATIAPAGATAAVLRTIWWDEAFRVIGDRELEGAGGGVALPSVAIASTLANGGALHRFDGDSWRSSFFGGDGSTQYAYGEDLALISRIEGGGAQTTLARYDPNTGEWRAELLPRDTTSQKLARAALDGPAQVFPPTVSGDYFTAEDRLYRLLPDGSWVELSDRLPVASTKLSLENRAPGYLVYEDQSSDPGERTTFAWLLHNGEVAGTRSYPGERVYTGDSGALPGFLAGYRAFVTYPADRDITAVDEVFLHRLLNHSFDDRQTDPVVAKVTQNLGDRTIETRYDFDGAAAVYDFSGEVVQYPAVREESGTTDEPSAAGFATFEYFNGLVDQVPAAAEDLRAHYSLLHGLLRSSAKGDASGVELERTETEWQAIELPYGEDSPVGVLLATTQIRQRRVTEVFGGLEGGDLVRRTELGYDPATALRTSSTRESYDASGTLQAFRRETLYAWRVAEYAGMKQARMLSQVAQETFANTAAGLTIRSTVTTWRDTWPSLSARGWAKSESWRWRGESPTAADFDFAAGSHPGWLLENRIDDRGSHGKPLLVTDVNGTATSFVYDRSGWHQVALFTNADAGAGEAGYVGFESYESLADWTLADGQPIPLSLFDASQSHSGSQSLRLPGQGTSNAIRAAFRLPSDKERVVVSCWVRTLPGFAGPAAWTLELAPAEGGTPIVTELPVADTGGAWVYLYRYLDLATPGAATVALAATLRNDSGQDLWLDDVRVAPVAGDLAVRVYEPATFLPAALLDTRTAATRHVYDELERPVAILGAQDQVLQVKSEYLSREGNDGYNPDDPNSELLIVPAQGGTLQNLRGGDWQRYWSSPDPGRWDGLDGGIEHRGSGLDTLTLEDPALESDYGIRLEVPARDGVVIDAPIGLSVGESLVVRWVPEGEWQMLDAGGEPVAVFAEPVFRHGSWLLVAAEHGVMFFRDRQLILAHAPATAVRGRLGVFAQTAGAFFRRILTFAGPQAAMIYSNGRGSAIQQQVLDDAGTIVSASLYDAAGRRAIDTKARPYAGGVFAYRSALVTGFDSATGQMTGELSEYYDGSDGRSDDEGYPYGRNLYAGSRSERLLAVGQAGRVLAITGGGGDHISTYVYATNTADTFPGGLPAAHYGITGTIDPQGHRNEVMSDTAGRTVAVQRFAPGSAEPLMQASYGYDSRGYLERIYPPNFHQPPAGESGEGYVVEITNDGLGRVVRAVSSERETEVIHDDAGNLRFVLPAEGRAGDPARELNRVRYQQFDRLGRLLEIGEAEVLWNEDLRLAARDPVWLPPGALWKNRYTYDGDGTAPWDLGRLSRAEARLPDAGPYEQRFSYDIEGNMTRVAEEVVGVEGFAATTEMSYNQSGQLLGIDYPAPRGDGTGLRLRRAYTRLGQLRSIGREGAPDDELAAFTYNPQGDLETETLDPPATAVETRFEYNSPGWLRRIDNDVFTQSLDYWEAPGYGGQVHYNGPPSRIENRFHGQSGMIDTTWLYAYDGVSRLASAECIGRPAASVGTAGRPLSFDANGNIRGFGVGEQGAPRSYEYYRETNRLRNADDPGVDAYGYDGDGNVVTTPTAEHAELAYDFVSGLTQRVTAGDGSRIQEIAYDASGQRLRTRAEGVDERRYFRGGISAGPLVEEQPEAAVGTMSYVHGPTGLVALVAGDGSKSFLVRDHLGSGRLLLDASGRLQGGYDYGPFGESLGAPAGSRPDLLTYRYTGQEWDARIGLYNYRARLYDPRLQRFLGPDPAEEFFSPYLYVGNNPLVATDPSGEFSVSGSAAGMALIVAATVALPFIPAASILLLGAAGPSGAYSAQVDDQDFSWSTWAQVGAAGAISFTEISLGVGLEVFGEFPGAAALGAAAIGAGFNSYIYAMTNTQSFSWERYAIDTGIGTVTGLITGGFGELGAAAAANVAAQFSSKVASFAGKAITQAAFSGVGGAVSGYVGHGLRGVSNGQSWSDSFWSAQAFSQGAVQGIVGAGVGLASVSVSKGASSLSFIQSGKSGAPPASGFLLYLREMKDLESLPRAIGGLSRVAAPGIFNAASQIENHTIFKNP